MLIQQDEIAIRLMQDQMPDYELMAKWLTDAQVLKFYEGRVDTPRTKVTGILGSLTRR
ncbi:MULTISPECIES: hypothetical protein [Nostoc]|uniref:Uncharacterized protein n=2 Tax=Nostoc TaxID=1177 RepID=A0ABR8I9H6_9NOSO|nr:MULTISPECIES: hypothetical protein [Nostoc]MBD2559275.1 hypothetical protein [Nostoc linckia FACHB-391]MBD2647426.1 hypothetical protein [Nostoc foliaceum FACHB-393]